MQTTERLDVEWEGGHASAVRRANGGVVVWERLRVSWPDALQGFAQRHAETAARSLAETVRRFEIQPRDEVFGFALVAEPAPNGTANMGLWAGLQSSSAYPPST